MLDRSPDSITSNRGLVGGGYGYGLAPLLGLDHPHRDALAFRQTRELRTLHNRDMHEDVLAAAVHLDEAHSLFRSEPLDGSKHVDRSRRIRRVSRAGRPST